LFGIIAVHNTAYNGSDNRKFSVIFYLSKNRHCSDEGDYSQFAFFIVNENANFPTRYWHKKTTVMKLLGSKI